MRGDWAVALKVPVRQSQKFAVVPPNSLMVMGPNECTAETIPGCSQAALLVLISSPLLPSQSGGNERGLPVSVT